MGPHHPIPEVLKGSHSEGEPGEVADQDAAKMLENASKQHFSKSKTYEMKKESGGKIRFASQRKLEQELPDDAAANYMQSCHAMKGWTKFCRMATCWLFRWDDSWMQTKTSRGFTMMEQETVFRWDASWMQTKTSRGFTMVEQEIEESSAAGATSSNPGHDIALKRPAPDGLPESPQGE